MVTLNGMQLPNPGNIDVGRFTLTKSGRAASGNMNMEIIARKRSVTISYSHLADADLKAVLNQLESRTFHTLTYPDPQDGTATITVYAGDVTYKPWRRQDSSWWWKEIQIPLIER